MLLDELENLSEDGQSSYDRFMEKLLTHDGCPQCLALSEVPNIKMRLMEEKKHIDRGELLACRSILQIPHRCGGEGVYADGFRYRGKRNSESTALV